MTSRTSPTSASSRRSSRPRARSAPCSSFGQRARPAADGSQIARLRGVLYHGLIAPLIEAVKELDARLSALEAQIGGGRPGEPG
jgi:hypothetical protein